MHIRLIAFLALFITYPIYANTYGPIKAGDMLWHIAAKVNNSNKVNRYQVMYALLKANSHAFAVTCNVNSLKVGEILNIPTLEEIATISAQQAIESINAQSMAWKQRRSTPIICQPEVTPQEVSQVEKLNIIPTLRTLVESDKKLNPIEIKDEKDDQSEKLNPPGLDEKLNNRNHDKTELSLITQTAPSIKTSTPEPITTDSLSIVELSKEFIKNNSNLLLIIVGILAVFVLILILMLIFLLYRLTSKKTVTGESPHHTVFSRVYEQPNSQQYATTQSNEDMKDKLAIIRTCLAEDEEAVQVLLKEVLEKGTHEQQQEARQLIEINRKIHQLEQHQQDDLQQVMNMSQYLPQNQFSAENKQQVFVLIDKIFELLDHELQANGKLIEAYSKRHQTDFFNGRPEKILVEKSAEQTAHHSHSTEKATRYL